MHKPVCVVVGVGPGNGAALARRFHREGYSVALLARSTDLSAQLATELPGARAYSCDVTNEASVAETFSAIAADMGAVEALVYNAGSGVWGTIEDLTAKDFEQSWRVNTLGAFLAGDEAAPVGLIIRGGGAPVRRELVADRLVTFARDRFQSPTAVVAHPLAMPTFVDKEGNGCKTRHRMRPSTR